MQVISINNTKGGVAKTSSVLTISQILAYAGYKVLVMDLDPQMNSTRIIHPSYEPLGLNYEHLFCEQQYRKESVQEFICKTDYENIDLLPADKQFFKLIYKIYEADKGTSVGILFKKNIAFIKNDYDYVIIDNSPFQSYLTTLGYFISDKVIIPIESDNFSYEGIMDLVTDIEEINRNYSIDVQFAGIFMTRINARTVRFKQMYENYKKAFGDKFIPVFIRNNEMIAQANTSYAGILEYDKKSPVIDDYIDLVKYLGLLDGKHQKKLNKFLGGTK